MTQIKEIENAIRSYARNYKETNPDNENNITIIMDGIKSFRKQVSVEPVVILPERNSFGQWISVNDRLPELDETVLCYSKVKDIDGDIYNVTSLGSRFINYTQKPVFLAESGRFAETIEIIKWMPLPKP